MLCFIERIEAKWVPRIVVVVVVVVAAVVPRV